MKTLKLPAHFITKNIKPMTDLELIACQYVHWQMTDDGQHYAIIELQTDEFPNYLIPINAADATYLNYIYHEDKLFNLLPTIYHTYLHTMNQAHHVVKKIVLEKQEGDFIHCRIFWSHYDTHYAQICTIGDALILSYISDVPLHISKSTIQDLTPYSEDDGVDDFDNEFDSESEDFD